MATRIDPATGELIRYDPSQDTAKKSESPLRILTEEEIALIAKLPAGNLRVLVERILRQYGLVACQSEEQLETALFDVLAMKGIIAADVPAIREYFDRKKGKPAQAIVTTTVQMTLAELVEASYKTPKLVGSS